MTEARSLGDKQQARLKTEARKNGWDVEQTLLHYVLIQLLHRLQQNGDADRYQLKGSLSVMRWTGAETTHRPTEDMDLNGVAQNVDNSALRDMAKTLVKAMRRSEEDGIVFNERSLQIAKEHDTIPGGKIAFDAYVGSSHVRVAIDVGFGNPVTPGPKRDRIDPPLRNMPAPEVDIYPLETTIAEKVAATLKIGIVNTRLKDIYDIWYLADHHTDGFDGETLKDAFLQTFQYHGVSPPPKDPEGFSGAFVERNRTKWQNFISTRNLHAPDFDTAMERVRSFVLPVITAVRGDAPVPGYWTPDEGWSPALEHQPR